MRRIRNFFVAIVAAVMLVIGGLAVTTPDSASAHTYVAGVSCGSSVSPSSGQIKIGYHYGSEPWHRFYWRTMTAGEYWTYCW
jgi:hypothetical protein